MGWHNVLEMCTNEPAPLSQKSSSTVMINALSLTDIEKHKLNIDMEDLLNG
jgi:hypothetical protein